MRVSKKTFNRCYTKEDENVDNTTNNYSDFEQSVRTNEGESFEDESTLRQKNQEFFNNVIAFEPESEEENEMPSENNEKYLNEKIDRVEQKIDLKDEAINNKIDALIRSTQHYENLMDGHVKEIKEENREQRREMNSLSDKIDGNFKWTLTTLFAILIAIVVTAFF